MERSGRASDRTGPDLPLARLDGRRLNPYTMALATWSWRMAGIVGFTLHLIHPDGGRSARPAAEGLYGLVTVGDGAFRYPRSFADVSLAARTGFEGDAEPVDLVETGIQGELVEALGDVLAETQGSWMYLAYGWKTLSQIQRLGHPYPVTDEGYLLFRAGFRGGWKDYYYAEAWNEGPIKLKAERLPTDEYRRLWDQENAAALAAFLARAPGAGTLTCSSDEGVPGSRVTYAVPALEVIARLRALEILRDLDLSPETAERVSRVLSAYPTPVELAATEAPDLAAFAARAASLLAP